MKKEGKVEKPLEATKVEETTVTTQPKEVIKRCEAMVIINVEDSNPNGDPDSDNRPRENLEGHGYMSCQCLKRKIRNLSEIRYGNEARMGSLSKIGTCKQDREDTYFEKNDKGDRKLNLSRCFDENYDLRVFGNVFTANKTSTGVKGAIQLTDAKSCIPITDKVITMTTSQAVANKMKQNKNSTESETGKLGRKHMLSHGVYTFKLFVNPTMCEKNLVTQKDIDLMIKELVPNMFEEDKSANRCGMSVKKVIVFNHDSKYGKVSSDKLFERVKVSPKIDNPLNYNDYDVSIDGDNLPEGVSISIID